MRFFSAIIHRLQHRWRRVLSSVAHRFMKAPRVLTIDETLDLIINQHYSVSRNGDGELNLMMGEAIDFQHSDPRLAGIMREALSTEMDKYISCLPGIFSDNSRFTERAQKYFDSYLSTKRYYYYTFAKASVYGNAFISRFYMDLRDKSQAKHQVEELKKIWVGQDVLLLEGKESRLGVNNDLFDGAKSLKRILGPSENAFDKYDALKSKVQECAKKDMLILLALGPTATAMSYELAKVGYWAVDIGHIDIEYEWYLMGATSKVAVPGKYTNECDEGKLSGTLPEEALAKYRSEIIAEIF